MNLALLFKDKTIKAKAKVARVGNWILSDELGVHELLVFSETQNLSDKATCIEALEYATRKNPAIADEILLDFMTATLRKMNPALNGKAPGLLAI